MSSVPIEMVYDTTDFDRHVQDAMALLNKEIDEETFKREREGNWTIEEENKES